MVLGIGLGALGAAAAGAGEVAAPAAAGAAGAAAGGGGLLAGLSGKLGGLLEILGPLASLLGLGGDDKDNDSEKGVGGIEGLLSNQNLLTSLQYQRQPPVGFAPQSYRGVPTFTGGMPYPPNDYERVRALGAILNNIFAGIEAAKTQGGTAGEKAPEGGTK